MSKRMYLIGWVLFWFNVISALANVAMVPLDVIWNLGLPAIILNSSCMVIGTMAAIAIRIQLRDVTPWEREL